MLVRERINEIAREMYQLADYTPTFNALRQSLFLTQLTMFQN